MKWLTCNVEFSLLFTHFQLMPWTIPPLQQLKKKRKKIHHRHIHNETKQASCVSPHTFFATRINTTDLLFHHKTGQTSFSMFPCLCNRGQITEKMIALQSKELFHRATVTTPPPSCFVYILQWRIYLLLRICCPFVFSSTGQLRGTTPPCLCASADQRKESIYNIFIHIFIYY